MKHTNKRRRTKNNKTKNYKTKKTHLYRKRREIITIPGAKSVPLFLNSKPELKFESESLILIAPKQKMGNNKSKSKNIIVSGLKKYLNKKGV